MMNSDARQESFAVFPFLKTAGHVHLGKFTFRSTDDRTGLTDEQWQQIQQIREMLFWRDDLRLKSSAFAVVPFVDPDRPYDRSSAPVLSNLAAVQATVAYMYGEPHEVFGEPFLSSEHATLLVLTRASVVRRLVFPDYHLESIVPAVEHEEDSEHPHVLGFHGLYNFRDQFWVTRGSRIHGPLPHMTLNISQDLALDVSGMPDGLVRLVSRPPTISSERILTAVRWFNESNAAMKDDAAAIVDLAIAFETLLGIPAVESKTDRFVDAIALLLGRTPRVDVWAHQFYNARSNVAHEGRIQQLRFVASDSNKPPRDAQLYHSLLSVGRHVFRLCLRTLSVGALLAEEGGLAEKFVTNKERFERICKILTDGSTDATTQLTEIASTVQAIHEYKWVGETGLTIAVIIGATRLAAQKALECGSDLPPELRNVLQDFLAAPKSDDNFERLEALSRVDNVIRNKTLVRERKDHWRVAVELLEDSWMICMWHFFRLERQRAGRTPAAT